MRSSDPSNLTRFTQFHTTRWSVVVRAQGKSTDSADESLASLCQQYWPPLYAYARRQGHSPHDAQDLTQEFFARFLEKNWLASADADKGKLRTFLLTAMKRFLANEWDRSQSIKRGGKVSISSIDEPHGESLLASATTLPDDSMYDRGWALTVLQTTLAHLKSEYEFVGKLREYELLKPTLTAARGEIGYVAIATALEVLPSSARSTIHRIRKRFREIFRAEVAGTVANEEEVDDEMRALIASLSNL